MTTKKVGRQEGLLHPIGKEASLDLPHGSPGSDAINAEEIPIYICDRRYLHKIRVALSDKED